MASPSVRQNHDAKLKSAESALTFVQKEHKKVLDQLHEEIRSLQQRCSDLQFSLTSSVSSAKAEAELREQVQQLQEESSEKDGRIEYLSEELGKKSERVEELEGQLRWAELDFGNQLASKDAKIDQLQRSLSATSEVGRLQGECKRIYDEADAQCEEKIEGVTRRAKTPSSTVAKRGDDSAGGDGSEMSSSRPAPPLLRPLPSPASTRSKVFRHKLQRAIKNGPVDRAADIMSAGGGGARKQDLPQDYRASVATLPPIMARTRSGRASQASPGPRRSFSVDVGRIVTSAAACGTAASSGYVDAQEEATAALEILARTSPVMRTGSSADAGGRARTGKDGVPSSQQQTCRL